MRSLWITSGVIALAALTGCAAQQTRATPPTVTYSFNDGDGYRQAARDADQFCLEKYRGTAQLLGRTPDGDGGYKATFSCE